MTRPDFLVIGAMKCGTTSLYRYLRAHPQIQMAEPKELHFFSEPEVWARGWDWYEQRFPVREAATVAVGEASTSYTKYPQYPNVAERIAEHLPEARLLYLMRDPIERMRSQYLHRLGEATESRPIERALLDDPSYLDWSRYAMQLERYRSHVPPERMLLVVSERLRDARRDTLRQVYGFLGADPDWTDPVQEQEFYRADDKRGFHPAAGAVARRPGLRRLARRAPRWVKRAALGGIDTTKGAIPDDLRAELAARLRDDVAALRTYLGPDFDGWGLA